MYPRGLREVSERPPRTSERPLRDLEGLNFITEFLTFYLLSRSFVVKTARRARLTFLKIYISLTSRETSRETCDAIARLTFYKLTCEGHTD